MNEILLLNALILSGFAAKVLAKSIFCIDEAFEKLVKLLADVTYYLLIPLAFFYTYSMRKLEVGDLLTVLYFLLFTALMLFLLIRRGGSDGNAGYKLGLFLASTFPNAVFLGFPVSLSIFGTIRVAAVFGLATLALNVLVPDFLSLRRISWRKAIGIPALHGFLAGVLVNSLGNPHITSAVSLLSPVPMVLSYTATFLLGMRLSPSISATRESARFMLITSAIRFALAPLLAYVYSRALFIDRDTMLQLVVISSMPPAVLNTLIAERYGWRPELVSTSTFIITLFYTLALYPIQYVAFGGWH